MVKLITIASSRAMRSLQECNKLKLQFYEILPGVELQIEANVIPTPEYIATLLAQHKNPEDIADLIKTFNKLKADCNKFKKIIENNLLFIDKIINKTNNIESIFSGVLRPLNIVSDLLPILRGIITTGQFTLAAQVGLVANGALIIKTDDAIKMAKGKIKQFETLTKILNNISNFYNKSTIEIRDELYPIRADFQKIYNIVSALCFTIDNRFLEKLNELTNLSIVDNEDISENDDIFNDSGITEDDINEIIETLENVNQTKFIQYFNNQYGLKSGYEILPKDL